MGGKEALSPILAHLAAALRKKNMRVASLLKPKEVTDKPRVAVFDSKDYVRSSFLDAAGDRYDLQFFDVRLSPETATLAAGFSMIVPFVNDDLGKAAHSGRRRCENNRPSMCRIQ